jgi:hypothetical protein
MMYAWQITNGRTILDRDWNRWTVTSAATSSTEMVLHLLSPDTGEVSEWRGHPDDLIRVA